VDDKGSAAGDEFLAAKRALELEKLRAEVALAKSQVTFLGNFSRLMWPVITSAVTVGVSLAALIVSLVTSSRQARLQYAQDEQKLFAGNLEIATNDALGATRRVTSIWTLSSFWADGKHDGVLAETLSALLSVGDDKGTAIGLAAADVIGLAITAPMDEQLKARRAALLYGSTQTWEVGTVVRQQKFLLGSDSRPCELPRDNGDIRVEATREAVRKNWEYLRHAHFRGIDLTGSRLYQADLTGAYLQDAKLDKADLRGATIEGADFTGSCVRGTNVKDVSGTPAAPENFRSWALQHGAVEMTEPQFDAWRQAGFSQPADWASWRGAGFPITKDGAPAVTNDRK
jgi:hypothetical protein